MFVQNNTWRNTISPSADTARRWEEASSQHAANNPGNAAISRSRLTGAPGGHQNARNISPGSAKAALAASVLRGDLIHARRSNGTPATRLIRPISARPDTEKTG